jgi:hypothetical protein
MRRAGRVIAVPRKFAADRQASRQMLDRKITNVFCCARVEAVPAEKAGMLSPQRSDRQKENYCDIFKC